jgi:hypothetical protein
MKNKYFITDLTCSGGYSWTAKLPDEFIDLPKNKKLKFHLYENDKRVFKNSNAMHDDIKAIGGGLHAYWGNEIICLSPTNGDNSSNALENEYSLQIEASTAKSVLPFGGCTIFDPIYTAQHEGLAINMHRQLTGSNNSMYTHTPGEHLQSINHIRGVHLIPPILHGLCNIPSDLNSCSFTETANDIDMLLIEICGNVEIVFRGTILNNNRLSDAILGPANLAFSADKNNQGWYSTAQKWFYDGLIKSNSERANFADKLLEYMPLENEGDQLLHDIVLESYPRKVDTETIFHQISSLGKIFDRPYVLVSYTQRYMPDGRPLSWPPHLHAELSKEAAKRGVKIFHPPQLVMEYTPKVALKEDMQHYNDDFLKIIGEKIINFI